MQTDRHIIYTLGVEVVGLSRSVRQKTIKSVALSGRAESLLIGEAGASETSTNTSCFFPFCAATKLTLPANVWVCEPILLFKPKISPPHLDLVFQTNT